MNKRIATIALCLLASGCATERHVARKISELELRRLAVETAMADRVAKVETVAATALSTAQTALKVATGKFAYEVVSTDQTIRFEMAETKLSPAIQARLVQFAAQLKADNRNVFVEVQGHTDSIGSADLNELVGLRRAENVRAFLYNQGIALNRMSSVSLGEYSPVASNVTEAGRAANRRVVLVVKA